MQFFNRQQTGGETPDLRGVSHEAMMPATLEQYTLWLEGHLMNGGHVDKFYMPYVEPVDMFGMKAWLSNLALATGDFDRQDKNLHTLEGILVPDHVHALGEAGPPLYHFDDYSVEGGEVRVYANPAFAELSPLLQAECIASLGQVLVSQSSFGDNWSWQRRRDHQLSTYQQIASILHIELSDDAIASAVEAAETQRSTRLASKTKEEHEQEMYAGLEHLRRASLNVRVQ